MILLSTLMLIASVKEKQIDVLEPQLRKSVLASALESGDLLFMTTDQVSSKLIRFVTKGPYSHVALYSGQEGGVHWIIDATTKAGVTKRSLSECLKESRYIVAARMPKLTKIQRDIIVGHAAKQLGKEYDYFGAIASARVMVGSKELAIRFTQDDQKFYCSELLVESFDALGLKDLSLAVSATGTSPNDLRVQSLTKRLEFIGLVHAQASK